MRTGFPDCGLGGESAQPKNAAANLQRRSKSIADFFHRQEVLDLMTSVSGRFDFRTAIESFK
jgi:hypothetical protein